MKTLAIGIALLAGLGVGNLHAADISSPALAKMGLVGVRTLSDGQGREVRGSPYPPMSADGGAFQVYFAHFVAGQYNFLPTSGFAAGAFSPVRVPLGGSVGMRGR